VIACSLLQLFCFSVAQQRYWNVGWLTVEVSRPHTIRHTQPAGLLWMSDQPIARVATYTSHNNQKRRTPMPPTGLAATIPAVKMPQIYVLVL